MFFRDWYFMARFLSVLFKNLHQKLSNCSRDIEVITWNKFAEWLQSSAVIPTYNIKARYLFRQHLTHVLRVGSNLIVPTSK